MATAHVFNEGLAAATAWAAAKRRELMPYSYNDQADESRTTQSGSKEA